MHEPKSILITGAGRGIGTALARAYADTDVHLFLGDIHAERLASVCSSLGQFSSTIHGRVIDITDRAAMEDWIAEAESIKPLDLVIANAAISHGNKVREETEDQIRAVFAVNLDGTLNTILPALRRFRERKQGQIAVMSSLAGFRGFPHAPSYCATKSAIRIFGQGLRARVKREGVSISVVIPAFVRTPMTDANLYGMPGIIEADKAASIIKAKLAKKKPEFIFPQPYPLLAWLLSVVPPSLIARITSLK